TYDEDNDGIFSTHTRRLILETNNTTLYESYYPNEMVGKRLYDIEVEEDLLEKDSNGNYINTMIEFIDLVKDVKKSNTFNKP
ncbi:MAG: hypothetical protein H7Y18_01640, partial [Clostridiaceae bacterium]|nr:hypothetical protein [Clostridiaceae bacterium]